MPLNIKQSKKFRSLGLPVSFKMNETGERLRDALNVFSNQDRLETRHGRGLYNLESLPGPILSLSFFENAAGTKHLLAKCGEILYQVNRFGGHYVLKIGLSATTKHRAITQARGSSSRHIIAIEEDGLFQFDGTDFTVLGQTPPTAPTVATTTGAVAPATYRVGLTFHSSVTGFESNLGTLSANVTTTAHGILITDIPTTAENETIDKVRIYLKNTASPLEPVFTAEISLGLGTYTIVATPTSQLIPPKASGKPLAGGAKYLTDFNRTLVYAGNSSFANDVFFSEMDDPDSFNDGSADGRMALYASLDGAITGLATGLYSNSVLDPFLVIFKRRSTHIYSEIGGQGKFVPISSEIGCVSHDTIRVKNGVVYFLSEQGWRVIANGSLVPDQSGNPATLGNGDIDDIFRTPGYAYEVNKSLLDKTFSVYYSTLDQYITWVSEGATADFSKAYVYEFKTNGFKPYEFLTPATAACSGIENSGEVVFMGDEFGKIYTHSIVEDRADQDSNGEGQPIPAFASMVWFGGDDLDASYNFRELILKRLAGVGNITVKVALNYNFEASDEFTFLNPQVGFILDVSKLDVDAFGTNERSIVTTRNDLNQVGESIQISFFQNGVNQNIGLIAAQIDFSKNGNRN